MLLEDILTWEMAQQNGPPLSKVADPPVCVFIGESVIVQLLFWINAPTSIHSHTFAGAWGVLRGSSFHCQYSFDRSEQITERLALGDLRFKSAEYLSEGCIRAIAAGNGFIHALLHLESPSISVLVRSRKEVQTERYSFLGPGLAYDFSYEPEPLRTKLALLSSVAKVDPALFEEAAAQVVETAEFWDACSVIMMPALDRVSPVSRARLVAILAKRHAGLAYTLAGALKSRAKMHFAKQSMASIPDPQIRLLIALLTHAPDIAVVERFLANRYPGIDPRDKLAELFDRFVQTAFARLRLEVTRSFTAMRP